MTAFLGSDTMFPLGFGFCFY